MDRATTVHACPTTLLCIIYMEKHGTQRIVAGTVCVANHLSPPSSYNIVKNIRAKDFNIGSRMP